MVGLPQVEQLVAANTTGDRRRAAPAGAGGVGHPVVVDDGVVTDARTVQVDGDAGDAVEQVVGDREIIGLAAEVAACPDERDVGGAGGAGIGESEAVDGHVVCADPDELATGDRSQRGLGHSRGVGGERGCRIVGRDAGVRAEQRHGLGDQHRSGLGVGAVGDVHRARRENIVDALLDAGCGTALGALVGDRERDGGALIADRRQCVGAHLEPGGVVDVGRGRPGDVGCATGVDGRAARIAERDGRGCVALLGAVGGGDDGAVRAPPVATEVLHVGAGCGQRAARLAVDDASVPVARDGVATEVGVGGRLHRDVRAPAAVEEQHADGPVVGDEVACHHGVVGLVPEQHAAAVVVDDVVDDDVAVAVVDVDARAVAGELVVTDLCEVPLALHRDAGTVQGGVDPGGQRVAGAGDGEPLDDNVRGSDGDSCATAARRADEVGLVDAGTLQRERLGDRDVFVVGACGHDDGAGGADLVGARLHRLLRVSWAGAAVEVIADGSVDVAGGGALRGVLEVVVGDGDVA